MDQAHYHTNQQGQMQQEQMVQHGAYDKSYDKNSEFPRARAAFFRECCANDDQIAMLRETARFSGLMCVHINTRGDANVLVPGPRPILKHLFLANARFRNDVVEYYRGKGFGWVDIIPLNRVDWKIFLAPPENRRAPAYVTPQAANMV